MIYHLPEYYFSGNRFEKSDLGFIRGCLMRMNEKEQKEACREYRQIYLRNMPHGRKPANQFLFYYANEHGVCIEEVKKLKATGKDKDWIKARISELRIAAKDSKPKIIT